MSSDPKALKKLARSTVASLETAFPGYDFTDEQKSDVKKLIESTLEEAVKQAALAHREATARCCGTEADMAHKINEASRRKTDLLVSNLMNLR
jgi:hypothetical protein